PDLPPAPVANPVSAITCTGFTASWQPVTGASRYYWELSTAADFSAITQSNNLATTSIAIASLAADNTYYFRVWSRNGTACPNGDTLVIGPIATLTTPPKVVAAPATNVACTAFTANWEAAPGATNYRLDVSVSPTFASYVTGYNNIATGNVVSYSVTTNLSPGTTYYYRVRPVNACLNPPAQASPKNSDTVTVNTLPLPATPAGLTVDSVGCNNFIVRWRSVPGVAGYTFQRTTVAAFTSGIVSVSLTDTTIHVTGLTAGSTHYFRVSANTGLTGCVSANTPQQSVTIRTIPAAPVAQPATNRFTCQFQANWALAPTATGYYLDVTNHATSWAAGNLVVNNLYVGNVNSYIVLGLNAGTAYRYRVRAVNDCGLSAAYSNIISTTTETAFSLAPPTPLPATFVLSCRFNAEWTAIPGATTYRLDVSEDINFGSFVGIYENYDVGNNTTWPVAGLSPNTTYYYRLRGQNPCGTSLFSDTIPVTTGSLLSVPASISITGTACDRFTANWGAVPGVTDYRLDVSNNPGFSPLLPGYNNLNVGNVTSYTVVGLTQNTTYYFRIRAVNQCGATSNSVVESLTTDFAETPDPQPATNITCSQFVANWDAVPGATSYRIDVATDPAFGTILGSFSNFNTGNVLSYTITGISPNNIYYYRVRAVKPCGTSASSGTITVDLTGGTAGLWTGAGNDNDWHNCVNWDDLVVPTSGDVVIPPPPTTTPLNVPTVTLNSLTMNNTLGIRMVGNVTVTSYLRLVLGRIVTQANRVIVTNNNPASSVINGSDNAVQHSDVNSYVVGTLERALLPGTAYVWPIGPMTSTQYLAIHAASVSGGLTRIACRFNETTPATFTEVFDELGVQFDTMLPNGYWTVTPDAGTASYNLEAFPNMGLDPSASYTLVKKSLPGDPWDRAGSTPVLAGGNWLNAARGSLRRDGYTTFSEVAIVTGVVILPTEGLQLSGTLQDGQAAQLSWTTLQEEDSERFRLLHRHGAQPEQVVYETAAAGYSADSRTYGYLHAGLQPGTHYYQVELRDLQGQAVRSNVVALAVAADGQVLAQLYPNPAVHEVTLALHGLANQRIDARLVNHLGQTVGTWELQPDAAFSRHRLSLTGLAKGVYNLQLVSPQGHLSTLRLVVLDR
ncbi:MAG: hypothetical protein KF690_09335, partial [Bacteroidetes bacterium]|nr:hypothetical protein [Bacteroidota bacterium]